LATRTMIKGNRGKITEYQRFLIRIPSVIAEDSQFPFKPGQDLTITVDPKGNVDLDGITLSTDRSSPG